MGEYEYHNSRFYELNLSDPAIAPLRFALLLKIGFVTIDTPRDSEKLCILLQSQTTTTTLLTLSSR